MKSKIYLLGMLLSLAFFGCNREDASPFNAEDAKINAQLDGVSDDVSLVAEDQYAAEQESAGKSATVFQSILPDCASVSASVSGTTWTRIVDFGTSGCAMPSGNILRGKIIVSGSTNFNTPSYTINYGFDNFFHNDRQVEGNRIVVWTLQSTTANATLHPVGNIELNLTVTYPNGNVYTRIGNRIRECISGFNTPFLWSDNIYSITGTWNTTFPSGVQTSTIIEPVVIRMNCEHIVSGSVLITRDGVTALLDFGDGQCDSTATVLINGNTTTILL